MIRILLTGGGTGGHIYPLLSVAEELQALAAERRISLLLKYIGAVGSYRFLLSTNGILVSAIIGAKIRRYFDLRNIIDAPLFVFSLFQALWKVFWFMPDVVFSKGGPGAFPIVLAARFYRIPVIIHESDSAPGLTSRLSANFAERIGVSFNSTVNFFLNTKGGEKLRNKIALVGNPIRKSLISGKLLEQGIAKKIFGFDENKKLILILGGSQGSTRINDFFLGITEDVIKDFQVLHQTGVKNFEQVKKELDFILKNYSTKEKSKYRVVPYFEKDLKDAYSAADIVVSRAGSGSIFEIAAFGKPAILIPLAESANNHQIENSYEYAQNGAAIVIEEENLKTGIFETQLKKALSNENILKSMSEAAKDFSKINAGQIIAEEVLKFTAK